METPANKKLYYFGENGNFTGEGESFSIVPGSTLIEPATSADIWDGEKWVTPPEPEQPTEPTEPSA